jgi:hypothetical protein
MRGIVLMVLGMLGFAAEDMFIKLASAGLPVGQILVVLGFPGALFFAFLARSRGQDPFSATFFRPAVLIRNAARCSARSASLPRLLWFRWPP